MKKTALLAIATCVAIALASCSKMEAKKESRVSPKDSLSQLILEREKTNGAIQLSSQTMLELNKINQQLLNSVPGDKVGKTEIDCYGENRSLFALPIKFGHEKTNNLYEVMLYTSPGKQLQVEYYSREVCDGIISKEYDSSGVILSQRWINEGVIDGKKVTVFYSQTYHRSQGTFYESFDVYPRTAKKDLGEPIERLSWKHKDLKTRPALPNEQFVSIGGPPEFFFKKVIEAFNKCKNESVK